MGGINLEWMQMISSTEPVIEGHGLSLPAKETQNGKAPTVQNLALRGGEIHKFLLHCHCKEINLSPGCLIGIAATFHPSEFKYIPAASLLPAWPACQL